MVKRHRNSQKRFYIKGAVYFITTATFQRYPYFNDDLLCALLAADIELCRRLKNFTLYGYKINPDHVHLLLRPGDTHHYSEIMRSLKTNFSRNVNRLYSLNTGVFNAPMGGFNAPMGGFNTPLGGFNARAGVFCRRRGHVTPPSTAFRWQSSFHDHIIRDRNDFTRHVAYIERQWIKHGLGNNKWCFIADECGGFTCD